MGDVPGVSGSPPEHASGAAVAPKWLRRRDEPGHARAMEAGDPEFARRYPALHEWMTVSILEGSARETSTLLVFCEDGRFKGCLHDREGSQVLFRSGVTFLGLLEALEACLTDGSADWREKKGGNRAR